MGLSADIKKELAINGKKLKKQCGFFGKYSLFFLID